MSIYMTYILVSVILKAIILDKKARESEKIAVVSTYSQLQRKNSKA